MIVDKQLLSSHCQQSSFGKLTPPTSWDSCGLPSERSHATSHRNGYVVQAWPIMANHHLATVNGPMMNISPKKDRMLLTNAERQWLSPSLGFYDSYSVANLPSPAALWKKKIYQLEGKNSKRNMLRKVEIMWLCREKENPKDTIWVPRVTKTSSVTVNCDKKFPLVYKLIWLGFLSLENKVVLYL